MLRKFLLGCGVAAPAWWVALDVIASSRFPGYSHLDQTVSELSPDGARRRPFMMVVNAIPYAALSAAFGIGVLAVSGRTRSGRVTGELLMTSAVVGRAGGILFPMMVRGAEGDLRNALHAPYGALSILLFLLIMSFGSRPLGQRFRSYTYATTAVMLVIGTLMAIQSRHMVAGEPTPWMGLEERISIYATMLWFAVLAIGLPRADRRPYPAAAQARAGGSK
jgi:hypothetical protein